MDEGVIRDALQVAVEVAAEGLLGALVVHGERHAVAERVLASLGVEAVEEV